MKTNEYKYIEYTDDNDYVIANVVMDGDKVVSVKITEDCLTNKTEYIELLQFLDEIKTMPWKYDDTDQECESWFKGHTHTHKTEDICIGCNRPVSECTGQYRLCNKHNENL